MSVSFSTLVQRARPASNHATSAAFRDVLRKLPPTNVSALGNGVRVACEENPLSKIATVGVWLESGSRYEPAQYSGASRVLEKCGFLGTTNQSADQIAQAVDELGGQIAVNVGREHTYLYMQVAKENTQRAVGLLADVVRNARLSDADISKARQLVLEEQRLFEERPDDIVMDNLHRCAFDSTPYGVGSPLYGTETGVSKVTADQLRQYRTSTVAGSRLVVVGAGGVDHTALEKAAQQHFGDLEKGSNRLPSESRYVGGEYRLWNLRYKTVNVAWGFQTCGAACEDNVPLALACEIPGSFHRSQHEMGQHAMHRVLKTFSSLDHSTPTNTHFNEKCIETANPFLQTYKDEGLCGMYVVGRPAMGGPGDAGVMVEVLQYTIAEWCRFAQKMLHDHELAQAKVNLKAQLLFNMDGSANAAQDIGRQVLHLGRRVPLTEMYDRIDDTTGTNVQEVLQHYFYGRKPVYSYLGYLSQIPNYDWTQHWTYKYWY
ncbi:mitochondrial processing peptidase [Strigomonas culicis]|uniref:Mitochondrial processing peptidase n=1 Tax=Strigomonas culicis TaxID=28005 RepID=S9VNJ4_9TRYP|nr:mitochondrial processing peptidase [Strigomonas culicis]EPY32210.1 mitochondrial processing peptidase [Strigomonas culicis]|eukprot:EPY24850.1 mitochondrial processing peptidase [Strigomonas culicis]